MDHQTSSLRWLMESKKRTMSGTENNLANHFDYDILKEISLCEPCTNGKHHQSSFPTDNTELEMPLGLVHSNVCGKMVAEWK